jgi:hypothetical protein
LELLVKPNYYEMAKEDPVLWGAYNLSAGPTIHLLEQMKNELVQANFKLESTVKDITYLIDGIKHASRNTELSPPTNDGEGSG